MIEQKARELCAKDESLKYLVQEYHDGLLLYEISTREVWDKAAKDTVGLEAYFKAHRSKYKWDEPRYRGGGVPLQRQRVDERRTKTVEIGG